MTSIAESFFAFCIIRSRRRDIGGTQQVYLLRAVRIRVTARFGCHRRIAKTADLYAGRAACCVCGITPESVLFDIRCPSSQREYGAGSIASVVAGKAIRSHGIIIARSFAVCIYSARFVYVKLKAEHRGAVPVNQKRPCHLRP